MSKVFTGSFYFDRTVNGNLIGEFSNNETEFIMTESAITKTINSTFEGLYTSTWYDDEQQKATLEITKIGFKYKLNWTEPGKQEYEGEGFLTADKLVGFYKKK